MKRALVVATTTVVLGGGAGALAAGPASAAYKILNPNASGAQVVVGTSFDALGTGELDLLNSSNSILAKCPAGSTSLSGVTATGTAGAGSSQLNIGVFTFPASTSSTPCTAGGAPLSVTAVVSPSSPWQVIPLSGSNTNGTVPAFGEVLNVKANVTCSPGNTVQYSGDLTTPAGSAVREDNVSTGSTITLVQAGTLTKTPSTVCPVLPNPAKLSAKFTLTRVGGAAVSSTNNLWLVNR